MKIVNFLIKILNIFERARHYNTQWTEDLPNVPDKKTIYIIGGRKQPYYAALPCPRKKCKKVIHLEIGEEFKKKWRFKEHENGTLSLHPSISVVGLCRCHYWIRRGHIVWCDMPPLSVPEENKTSEN